MSEFKVAATVAIGCIAVAFLSMWYSLGVNELAINLWRQL